MQEIMHIVQRAKIKQLNVYVLSSSSLFSFSCSKLFSDASEKCIVQKY